MFLLDHLLSEVICRLYVLNLHVAGVNVLRLSFNSSLLSHTLVAEVILERVLHEHTTGHWVYRLPMHLLQVLDVVAKRDLVCGSDQASEG